MSKKVCLRDWLTTVKAALIVFAGIGAIIGLINIKPLSKLSRCAANIFFVLPTYFLKLSRCAAIIIIIIIIINANALPLHKVWPQYNKT